jgi:hypothetical protein
MHIAHHAIYILPNPLERAKIRYVVADLSGVCSVRVGSILCRRVIMLRLLGTSIRMQVTNQEFHILPAYSDLLGIYF